MVALPPEDASAPGVFVSCNLPLFGRPWAFRSSFRNSLGALPCCLFSIELPDGGDDECDSESVGDSEGVSAGSRIGGADNDAFGLP